MAERLYEPLNGAEARQWLEQLIGQLLTGVAAHPMLHQHISWPRAEATLTLHLGSPDSQPAVDIRIAAGPLNAPDEVREQLALAVPVVVEAREGKRETRTSAKVAKSVGRLGAE